MLLERRRSQLLVIDIQERLAPHVSEGDAVVARAGKLLRYARVMGVPATVTEHYPKGLGRTVDRIREAAGNDVAPLEKISFSCWRDAAIHDRIDMGRRNGRDQVVVSGMEAHVCVGQTVLDLLASGLHVFLVGDAVGSRSPDVRALAIARMRAAGAHIVAEEMVAFEWLGRGDVPELKDVLAILK
jgi:nicotinamidase-related amidase